MMAIMMLLLMMMMVMVMVVLIEEFLQSLLDRQSPIEGVKVLNHNWEQVSIIIIIMFFMNIDCY